jgi:transposase, IS30 family
MGATKQQRATWAMRGKVYSPGRPPDRQREQVQRFWQEIARGATTEEAAVAVGVSVPVGSRLFRQAGGMCPISLVPMSGRYLSLAEREEIAIERARGSGVREIARHVGRSPSTLCVNLQ